MPCLLVALSVDANDPPRLAHFWGGLLRVEPGSAGALGPTRAPDAPERIGLLLADDTGLRLRFLPSQEQKTSRNHLHLDLTSSSPADQQRTVATALRLGARHVDVGQRPEEGHVVLADPEGNELCVIEPGNRFLAGCGSVGAVSGDGSAEVGHFWSRALGWPLVWDQDEETAIRSPLGGPKLTWGGPPLMPRTGKSRLHLDLAPPAGGNQRTEVDRLVSLGATPVDIGQRDVAWEVLADPDGREFCVLPAPPD